MMLLLLMMFCSMKPNTVQDVTGERNTSRYEEHREDKNDCFHWCTRVAMYSAVLRRGSTPPVRLIDGTLSVLVCPQYHSTTSNADNNMQPEIQLGNSGVLG